MSSRSAATALQPPMPSLMTECQSSGSPLSSRSPRSPARCSASNKRYNRLSRPAEGPPSAGRKSLDSEFLYLRTNQRENQLDERSDSDCAEFAESPAADSERHFAADSDFETKKPKHLRRGSYSAAQLCSVIGDSKDMALIRDPALSSLEVATDDSDTASRGNSPRMKRKHLLAHSHSQPLVQSHSSSLDESRGGTLTFSLDEDMLRDAFRNPPSDRHLPPEAMRGRKSLPSVSYDKNCKRWFWQKRNGSVSHCTRSGYREPTLRQWLKDVQRTFKKRGKKHRNRIKGHLRRSGKMPASPEGRDEFAGSAVPLSPGATKRHVCAACASVVPYTAHRAAMVGHLDCVRASVRRGAKKTSRNGDTLLHVAAKHGRIECLRWMMANYNDMKVWDANSKGNTVIHCAMDSGSVDCAKTVMAAVSARDSTVMTDGVRNMLYQANSNGMTPILIAVSQNHFDLVDFLLGTFGDQLPGIVNNKVGGATVFHYAAAVGSVPILTRLSEFFPQVASLCVPQTGKLPIHLAVHTGHLEAAQFLHGVTENGLWVRSADGLNCFNQAVMNGHLGCLKWMFNELGQGEEESANIIEQVDAERATLFHFAAAYGETKVMQFLLGSLPDKSFATNARDVWERTPLHDAAEKNHLNCLKLLLAAGGDIFAVDKEGNSPYSLAMQHDKLRTFIEQNMSGCTIPESAKKAVAAQKEAAAQKAKPAPVEPMAMDEGAESTTAKKNEDAPLARNVGYRTSMRFRAKKERPEIIVKTAEYSTIAPQHAYEAVTFSTTDNDDSANVTPSLTPTPLTNMAKRPLPEIPVVPAVMQHALPPCFTPPAHRSFAARSDEAQHLDVQSRDRSSSTSDVFVMPSMPAFPKTDHPQPSVKLIYACSSMERIHHEVQKLAFAMEMIGARTSVVRVRKETFPTLKVKNSSGIVRWLQAEKEGFDSILVVCTAKLFDLFELALWGGKVPKPPHGRRDAAEDCPERRVNVPPELHRAMVPVVLLHGGSSRYCPQWLRGNQCFYWPKNQPALFSNLGIKIPKQTLSVPTCKRKRANTM